ncbi:MAG: capsular polysaccharide biosynthesis protein, partial [bacterium]
VMLAAALRENPDADIFVKTHPDVIAGKKKGCLSLVDLPKQVCVITNDVNPLVLLEQMDHVYVATSQMGFEALMLGKAVTCFGVPFYAGWGVTDDRASADLPVFQRRNKPRSLEEIFAATYLLYARYWHPDTRQRCEAEDLVAFFELQYQYRVQAREDWCVLGLKRSFWKHRYLCHFLQANKKQVSYYRQPASAECKLNASCGIAVWGSRQSDQVAKLENEGATIWRVEDGFIRSVGLGSDYVAPQSLVIDRQGIYYDPSRPSDLEVLLQNYEFTEDLLHRARKLRQLLLDVALSKYNAGLALDMASLSPKLGQQIILVVGQVEDDASIQLGCREIKSNLALLRTVRDANPDHYIIYKPHPDVVSGNRVGYVSEEMVHCYADIQLDDISITECLDAVDEVHTMTSLVGFEALLRGLLVRCYGMPFYAGWGLTLDMYTLPRRNRVLSLDELVAASLILYPRYMNWETGLFTTPEFTLTSLAAQVEQQGGKQRTKQPWLLRQLRKLYLIYKGVTYRV